MSFIARRSLSWPIRFVTFELGSFSQDYYITLWFTCVCVCMCVCAVCLGVCSCLSSALALLETCIALTSVQLEDPSPLFQDVLRTNHPAGGVSIWALNLLSKEQQAVLTGLVWPLSPDSQILVVVSTDEICFQSQCGLLQFGAWTCSVCFAAPQCPPSHFAQTPPRAASYPAAMAASIRPPWWVVFIYSCTLSGSVQNNRFFSLGTCQVATSHLKQSRDKLGFPGHGW